MANKAHCLNCRRLRWIQAEGRCKGCWLYLLRTGRERPYLPLVKKKYSPQPMCECGRARTSRVIVVPNGRAGHWVRIRVCEMCWEMEKG